MIRENALLRREIAQTDQLKSIATLASGMAHEIKNPLTAIKTFTEYLPKKLDDKEFLQKFAQIVGNEVDRIDNLVNDLLDYAKPAPPQFSDTNINKLLEDTVELLNNQMVAHNVQLHKDIDSTRDLQISADPKQLRQALLNILMNAIEAMPAGGTLFIGTRVSGNGYQDGERDTGIGDRVENPRSSIADSRFPNPYLIISIKDTGVGIDKKDLPHIFDPFFTKKDRGTGLGLAITQGILHDHAGKIKVTSTVNIGTEILIELPLSLT